MVLQEACQSVVLKSYQFLVLGMLTYAFFFVILHSFFTSEFQINLLLVFMCVHMCDFLEQMVNCINDWCLFALSCMGKLLALNAQSFGNRSSTLNKGCLHIYRGMFVLN